jgi:hypothetical protein
MKNESTSTSHRQCICAGRRFQIKELAHGHSGPHYVIEGAESDLLEAGLVAQHQVPAPRPHCKWSNRRDKLKVNRVFKTYRPPHGGLRVTIDAIVVARLDSDFQQILISIAGSALAPRDV